MRRGAALGAASCSAAAATGEGAANAEGDTGAARGERRGARATPEPAALLGEIGGGMPIRFTVIRSVVFTGVADARGEGAEEVDTLPRDIITAARGDGCTVYSVLVVDDEEVAVGDPARSRAANSGVASSSRRDTLVDAMLRATSSGVGAMCSTESGDSGCACACDTIL